MTETRLWQEFESGDNYPMLLLRTTVVFCCVCLLVYAGLLELTWPQQAILGVVTVLIAVWMDRSSSSYLITLTLMMASCYSTFRYAYWRISTVIKFFMDPASQWGGLDAFFIFLLVLAEAYSFSILYLGYIQTIWPLRRTPVPLPDDPEDWPAVDVLIPTYNEPLNVVRYTALAATLIDWPADRLNVYVLDDGNREEFRVFCEEAGIGYMTRDDNAHAKAGNINRALKRLNSPLVAIFDSDHVPTRSFLQVTIGWFMRDRKLGMLQTPHHFYSPDPFERNLGQFRAIPNEGELFYGIVQDGNDLWNATFFCGSCAVLRREALDEIGGIAVETVTEDAHTSLRMQINGWNTAYINIPQAAGLATERLSGHVKQRIRWARGMIQIMRTDNPLFVPGLKLMQRICYFNAMTHFLYGLPRLIFLFAPLIYLILGHTNVPGYWAAILAYAFPHGGIVDAGHRAFIPLDVQRVARLLRMPPGVGHHRHAVADPHHVDHAGHGLGLGGVDAGRLAADDWTLRQCGVHHAGQLDVDAVFRAAVDLVRRFQPPGRLADDLEILGIFQRDLVRHGQPGCGCGQLAVGGAAPAGAGDLAVGRM